MRSPRLLATSGSLACELVSAAKPVQDYARILGLRPVKVRFVISVLNMEDLFAVPGQNTAGIIR